MGVVRVSVASDLLQWAVKRAGWSEEYTYRRAPRFEEWVGGAVDPTLKQLEKFAADTHTPFGMLFLSEPPVEEIPIPDMRTVRNSGVSEPSADLLDTIYACQQRQEWYRDYAVNAGAPVLEFVGSTRGTEPPEEVAHRIREMLDLEKRFVNSWSDAMTDLITRAESLGILVMVNGVVGGNTHRRLNPEEFRGFALSDDVAPLVFVNGADTKAAQIFTLVHEFAHLWLGHSALSDADPDQRGGVTEERWCNAVAAEVLVPLDALRTEYRGEATEEELDRLACKYRVSTLVVLKRILDAGCLAWNDYISRYESEQARVMEFAQVARENSGGGNYYYTQLRRLGKPFVSAVIASTLEGSTTYRDAYRLLGAKKHSTFEGMMEKVRVA